MPLAHCSGYEAYCALSYLQYYRGSEDDDSLFLERPKELEEMIDDVRP